MKLWRVAAVAVLFLSSLVLLPAPGRAEPAEPPHLVVEPLPGAAPAGERLRAMDPAQLLPAMRLVGLTQPGPPIRVIVAPEGSGPARLVPPWISGYALSDKGLIVVMPQRVPNYPDSSLEDLLRHEVAHVLIARASGDRPLPRWFHEGLAMIAGGSWGFDDRSRLTLALLADRPVSLAELEERFSGGQSETNRAYAIAGAFVRDLFERYGPEAAPRLLTGVSKGLTFQQAFLKATGVSLSQAETAFWSRQTFWYRWVPVLTSSITLWLLITMLALWAIRRRRARDAAQRLIWDEEEERARLAAEARARLAEEGEGGEWVN
jgi:peptidase MA superfamily protein